MLFCSQSVGREVRLCERIRPRLQNFECLSGRRMALLFPLLAYTQSPKRPSLTSSQAVHAVRTKAVVNMWLGSQSHFPSCLIPVILPQTPNATLFTKISRLQLFLLLICASYRQIFQIVTEVLEIIRPFSVRRVTHALGRFHHGTVAPSISILPGTLT